MTRPVHRLVIACCAVILIAVAGLSSARMMAPERAHAALAQAQMQAFVFGTDADEICGTLQDHHDHHCPFCALTPDTPHVAPAAMVAAFRPHDGWRQAGHLTRAAQARRHAQTPRAPPLTA